MDNDDKPLQGENSLETLEPASDSSIVTNTSDEKNNAANQAPEIKNVNSSAETIKPAKPKRHTKNPLKIISSRLNIYLFIFIILLGGVIIGLFVLLEDEDTGEPTESISQELTEEAIEQLNNSDVKIGDPRFTLGIESDTVFAGTVLIRDNLDVAGSLQLGGGLTLADLTASGQSTFDQIQANSISITNNASVQGQMIVQGSVNVTGGGNFGEQISAPSIAVENFELNGNLRINRHITTGGGSPGRGNGNSLGGGGTTSVSGTDTAGTVVINSGNNPSAGCYISVNFVRAYGRTPSVILSPASNAAGSMNYYTNRSNSGFSVCASSTPSSGQNYVFDYIVIE